MDKVISIPRLANYHVPARYLFKHITNIKLIVPPDITEKTIELGSKYSPDFICTPFKYTLGSFIEGLERGANILIQPGGGCRYGYYYELQEKILKDLGYNCKIYSFVTCGHTDLKRVYKLIKSIDPKINIFKLLYYGLITKNMINYMDKMDDYIRKNKAFEEKKGSFDLSLSNALKDFENTKGILNLRRLYKKHLNNLKNIKLNKPKKVRKVGVIGELYTVMEPFANYNIEEFLIKNNIEVTRYTNATYLLFKKKHLTKKYLKNLKNVKYKMGADAMDNIYHTKYFIDNNYDGIIHIKSSFCTPEIGSMGIINKMCKENDMPVLFFSFDSNTSKVGLETRLEAFIDMLEMRDNN